MTCPKIQKNERDIIMLKESYCSKCGTKNEGDLYCHSCRHRINQQGIDETTASTSQENMKMYIGDNFEYYLEKWDKSPDPLKTMSWNWAAFLFSVAWFGYRKMYLNLIIFLAVLAAISIYDTPFTKYLSYLYVFFVGLYGNTIYFRHVKKNIRIAETMNLSQEALNSKLKETGGTSLRGVLFSVLLAIIYGVVLGN